MGVGTETTEGTTVGTTLGTTVRTTVRTTARTTMSTTLRTTLRTLSAAQLIRLCFTTGRGCDFNQDFSSRTEAKTTRATPSPSPPTLPPRSAAKTREDQAEMLRQRLKLCFFSSICEIDESSKSS